MKAESVNKEVITSSVPVQTHFPFFNRSFDKKRLKQILSWYYTNQGEVAAFLMVESFQKVGFTYAMKAGISLGVDDLEVPPTKMQLLEDAVESLNATKAAVYNGGVTAIEEFQQFVDTWHRTSENLKQNVVKNFTMGVPLTNHKKLDSDSDTSFSTYAPISPSDCLASKMQALTPIGVTPRRGVGCLTPSLTPSPYRGKGLGKGLGNLPEGANSEGQGLEVRQEQENGVSPFGVQVKKTSFQSYGDTLNPVYMMAFSGARGNLSQVRQLVGMRGLMADPQGHLVEFPIQSNFREGLTVTEYMISCYGARKGLVDTALRTAAAGYLTRRLVDVSHNEVVRSVTCSTKDGIWLGSQSKDKDKYQQNRNNALPPAWKIPVNEQDTSSGIGLKVALEAKQINPIVSCIGRVLARDIPGVAFRNQETDISLGSSPLLKDVYNNFGICVRSPLTCKSDSGICQLCYGWSVSANQLIGIGEAVGVIAAQSIGEPGTQLTMRTFHTGGVFSGEIMEECRAKHPGIVSFQGAYLGLLVRTEGGTIAFCLKTSGVLQVIGTEQCTSYNVAANTLLFVRQGEKISINTLLLQIPNLPNKQKAENSSKAILSPISGEIRNTSSISPKLGNIRILSGQKQEPIMNILPGAHRLGVSTKAPLKNSKVSVLKSTKSFTYYHCGSEQRVLQKNIGILRPHSSELLVNLRYFITYTVITSVLINKNTPLDLNVKKTSSFFNFLKNQNTRKKGHTLLFSPELRSASSTNPARALEHQISKAEFTNAGVVDYFFKPCLKNFEKNLRRSLSLFTPQGNHTIGCFKSSTGQTFQALHISSDNNSQYINNLIKNTKPQQCCLADAPFALRKQQEGLKSNNFFEFLNSMYFFWKNSLLFPIKYRSCLLKFKRKPSISKFQRGVNKKWWGNSHNTNHTNFFRIHYTNKIFASMGLASKGLAPMNLAPTCFFFGFCSLPFASFAAFAAFAAFASQEAKAAKAAVLPCLRPKAVACLADQASKGKKRSSSLQSSGFAKLLLAEQKSKKAKQEELLRKEEEEAPSCSLRSKRQKVHAGEIFPIHTGVSEYTNLTGLIAPTVLRNKGKMPVLANALALAARARVGATLLGARVAPSGNPEGVLGASPEGARAALQEKDKARKARLFFYKPALSLGITHNDRVCYNLAQKNPCNQANSSTFIAENVDLNKNKQIGTFINQREEILQDLGSSYCGQIIEKSSFQITLRLTQNILYSHYQGRNAKVNKYLDKWIDKGTPVVTLPYSSSVTGDIIAGIPKIEQFFEARGEALEAAVDTLWAKYECKFRPKSKAVRECFKDIGLFLVQAIQAVYLSQGVHIADKHLEVIVRQMTRRACIIEPGDTSFLSEEFVDLKTIECVNWTTYGKGASYRPGLIGITRASLNSNSFLSSASFQQTARVLQREALKKKTDRLLGLKERVMIGALIDAGTGGRRPEVSLTHSFSTADSLTMAYKTKDIIPDDLPKPYSKMVEDREIILPGTLFPLPMLTVDKRPKYPDPRFPFQRSQKEIDQVIRKYLKGQAYAKKRVRESSIEEMSAKPVKPAKIAKIAGKL